MDMQLRTVEAELGSATSLRDQLMKRGAHSRAFNATSGVVVSSVPGLVAASGTIAPKAKQL